MTQDETSVVTPENDIVTDPKDDKTVTDPLKAKADDDTKAKVDDDTKAKVDDDAKAKAKTDVFKAKSDDDKKAKADDDTKAKADDDKKAKADDDTKAKVDDGKGKTPETDIKLSPSKDSVLSKDDVDVISKLSQEIGLSQKQAEVFLGYQEKSVKASFDDLQKRITSEHEALKNDSEFGGANYEKSQFYSALALHELFNEKERAEITKFTTENNIQNSRVFNIILKRAGSFIDGGPDFNKEQTTENNLPKTVEQRAKIFARQKQ